MPDMNSTRPRRRSASVVQPALVLTPQQAREVASRLIAEAIRAEAGATRKKPIPLLPFIVTV